MRAGAGSPGSAAPPRGTTRVVRKAMAMPTASDLTFMGLTDHRARWDRKGVQTKPSESFDIAALFEICLPRSPISICSFNDWPIAGFHWAGLGTWARG